jgi:hypothetical protein
MEPRTALERGMTARGLRPQAIVTALLPAVVQAEIAVAVSPVWLLRPGRAEAVRWWPLLCQCTAS